MVAEEVREEGAGKSRAPGTPEQLLLRHIFREGRIAVRKVRNREMLERTLENPRLSGADAASLCLAREIGGRLVADDKDLRSAARALGVPLGGSLYILGLAVERTLITPGEAVKFGMIYQVISRFRHTPLPDERARETGGHPLPPVSVVSTVSPLSSTVRRVGIGYLSKNVVSIASSLGCLRDNGQVTLAKNPPPVNA